MQRYLIRGPFSDQTIWSCLNENLTNFSTIIKRFEKYYNTVHSLTYCITPTWEQCARCCTLISSLPGASTIYTPVQELRTISLHPDPSWLVWETWRQVLFWHLYRRLYYKQELWSSCFCTCTCNSMEGDCIGITDKKESLYSMYLWTWSCPATAAMS